MSLNDRLRTLKRQSGDNPGDPASKATPKPGSGPTLAERVQRLRPGESYRPPAPRHRSNAAELASMVEGQLLKDEIVLTERRLSLEGRHGRFLLSRLREKVSGLPESAGLTIDELLFIDTETTGLAGGAGTLVFMLGMGRVEGHSLVVRQYLLTNFAGEATFLEAGAAWAADAGALVSFNGKSFDLPLLAGRFRLTGFDDPLSGLPHVDLLHPTRRAYGTKWEDCRLTTAERRLLQFTRQDDLPGAEAPAAWFAYIHAGDASNLPGVVRHNYWDVVSLGALWSVLHDVHEAPHRWKADVTSVARAHLKRGEEEKAVQLLKTCQSHLERDGLLELARLYRRQEAWDKACAIWTPLAEKGCAESLERLAKYHEHVRGDFVRALDYARRLPLGPERMQREQRLRSKLFIADQTK